jgi:hypothetical protein
VYITSTSSAPILNRSPSRNRCEIVAVGLQVGSIENRPEDALHVLDVLADFNNDVFFSSSGSNSVGAPFHRGQISGLGGNKLPTKTAKEA